MKSRIASVVTQMAESVQEHLQLRPASAVSSVIPRCLDLHFITQRIMVMSQPSTATHPTYVDAGRDYPIQNIMKRKRPNVAGKKRANNPVMVQEFLEGRNALVINVSDEEADDLTLTLLKRQWVQWQWKTSSKQTTETPEISQLFDLCYLMDSYLQMNNDTSIVVCCQNGKTRSAIVVACFLKYMGWEPTTMDGFSTFLECRCPELLATSRDDNTPTHHIPPSLIQLFSNFDSLVDLQDYPNPKPLFLRAIALQGIPVDDTPCIDIYSSQRLVYTSHGREEDSLWADEEGFFKIDVELEGDFLIVCRFGGQYANDESDPSKVLWRYAQTTAFLSSGNFELPKSKVDISRRYERAVEEEDFLLTIVLESYWDFSSILSSSSNNGSHSNLPPILRGHEALEQGWHVLTHHHAAQPIDEDVQILVTSFRELHPCPHHVAKVALQLSNFEYLTARDLLVDGPLKGWWMDTDSVGDECEDESYSIDNEYDDDCDSPLPTCRDVLHVLQDDQDETDSLDLPGTPPQHTLLSVSPTVFPNRGDIVDRLPRIIHEQAEDGRRYPTKPHRPRIPQNHKKKTDNGVSGEELEVLPIWTQINHTGVSMSDLIDLQREANKCVVQYEGTEVDTTAHDDADMHTDNFPILETAGKGGDISKVESNDDEGEDEDVEGWEVANDGDAPADKNARVLGHVPKDEPQESKEGEGEDVPLKDDPKYAKYFKMLKMGLTMDIVKHGMKRDGEDPSIMDLDHNKSVKSQLEPPTSKDSSNDPPLREDPKYEKYFRMLKMSLPKDAVKHSMQRDGEDPTILDLDPSKSLKSQRAESTDKDVPINQDPEFKKYFKMLEMGLPMGAVKNALQRDGKDPSIMDLDPNKSLKSQQGGGDDGLPINQDPEFKKYFKMLEMGLPVGAVKNALQRDGKDPSIMDLDPNKSLKSQTGEKIDTGPPLKDDPEYQKYFKMLKMGLPVGAVKNALQRDGKDPGIMDLDPDRSLQSQMESNEEEPKDTGTPLKDDPEYSKYFKMLKMGLPVGAVKNALQRDGKDASIMDLDPEHSVAYQLARKKRGGGRAARKKPKKRVRRKKIYWTPLDPSRVVEGSLWSMMKGKLEMEQLEYDQTEFETLFTESANPADKKKKAAKSEGEKKQKQNVQLIDGKRSMNGGIILARLKMEYSQIADLVNNMDPGTFDSTQLKALKEFLPTDEERGALGGHMNGTADSEEKRRNALSSLPECEKYMIAMLEVKNPNEKFDAMLFKVQFQSRLDELLDQIKMVKKACDEVKSSEKIRTMMAMILTLVNQINTGGDGNMAVGFNLDALLKLNEAKAFDKKTSVLHYLIKLVRQNDKELLEFEKDIPTVPIAENAILDSLASDMKALKGDVDDVAKTARKEADILEKEGKLPPSSAKDENGENTKTEGEDAKEEKEDDDQGNNAEDDTKKDDAGDEKEEEEDKVELLERTPMEIFAKKASHDVDETLQLLGELRKKYDDLLKYFGEDEKMPSNEFFGTLQKFVKEFKNAADHVEKIERQKLKEKLKKAAKKASAIKKLATSPRAVGKKPDLGSLAALAAKKGAKNAENEVSIVTQSNGKAKDVTTEGANESAVPAASSLAAMAAAAAAKKKVKPTVDTPQPGTLAMMAAAAAKKKVKPTVDTPQPGTLAVMAAAAAKRMTAEKSTDQKEKEKPDSGTLAAMAAAAAAKRTASLNNGQSASETTESKKPDAGSLAMMAAAAAAKRQSSTQNGNNDENLEVADAPRKPDAGSLAMMAAAAAAKRNQNATNGSHENSLSGAAEDRGPKDKSNGKDLDESSGATRVVPQLNAGSLAAMAAAAAAKRNNGTKDAKDTATQLNQKDIKNNVDERKPNSASLAAAAAKRRVSGQNGNRSETLEVAVVKESNPSPSANLAAKRNQEHVVEVNETQDSRDVSLTSVAATESGSKAKSDTEEEAPRQLLGAGSLAMQLEEALSSSERTIRADLGDSERIEEKSTTGANEDDTCTNASEEKTEPSDEDGGIISRTTSNAEEKTANVSPPLEEDTPAETIDNTVEEVSSDAVDANKGDDPATSASIGGSYADTVEEIVRTMSGEDETAEDMQEDGSRDRKASDSQAAVPSKAKPDKALTSRTPLDKTLSSPSAKRPNGSKLRTTSKDGARKPGMVSPAAKTKARPGAQERTPNKTKFDPSSRVKPGLRTRPPGSSTKDPGARMRAALKSPSVDKKSDPGKNTRTRATLQSTTVTKNGLAQRADPAARMKAALKATPTKETKVKTAAREDPAARMRAALKTPSSTRDNANAKGDPAVRSKTVLKATPSTSRTKNATSASHVSSIRKKEPLKTTPSKDRRDDVSRDTRMKASLKKTSTEAKDAITPRGDPAARMKAALKTKPSTDDPATRMKDAMKTAGKHSALAQSRTKKVTSQTTMNKSSSGNLKSKAVNSPSSQKSIAKLRRDISGGTKSSDSKSTRSEKLNNANNETTRQRVGGDEGKSVRDLSKATSTTGAKKNATTSGSKTRSLAQNEPSSESKDTNRRKISSERTSSQKITAREKESVKESKSNEAVEEAKSNLKSPRAHTAAQIPNRSQRASAKPMPGRLSALAASGTSRKETQEPTPVEPSPSGTRSVTSLSKRVAARELARRTRSGLKQGLETQPPSLPFEEDAARVQKSSESTNSANDRQVSSRDVKDNPNQSEQLTQSHHQRSESDSIREELRAIVVEGYSLVSDSKSKKGEPQAQPKSEEKNATTDKSVSQQAGGEKVPLSRHGVVEIDKLFPRDNDQRGAGTEQAGKSAQSKPGMGTYADYVEKVASTVAQPENRNLDDSTAALYKEEIGRPGGETQDLDGSTPTVDGHDSKQQVVKADKDDESQKDKDSHRPEGASEEKKATEDAPQENGFQKWMRSWGSGHGSRQPETPEVSKPVKAKDPAPESPKGFLFWGGNKNDQDKSNRSVKAESDKTEAPKTPGAEDEKDDASTKSENPFQLFMKSLTFSPHDKRERASIAIENDLLSPTLDDKSSGKQDDSSKKPDFDGDSLKKLSRQHINHANLMFR